MKIRITVRIALFTALLLMLFAATAENTQDSFQVKAIFNETPQMLEYCETYTLNGYISSTLPITSVHAVIYCESSLENEYEKTVHLNPSACEYPLEKLIDRYAFFSLSRGEKTLIITCQSDDKVQEACRIRFTILGVPEEPKHITDSCTFTMRGNRRILLEGEYSPRSCWKPQSLDDPILISLPEPASAMRIDWLTPPSGFLIECMDENGAVVKAYDAGTEYAFYTQLFDLGEGIKEIKITLSDLECGICAVRVYGTNMPKVDIPDFQSMPETIDLLVVSTHEDDELLMFGGAIPYYTAKGKDVGVLYMTDCGRHRYQEAMNGLWMTGVSYHPVFLGLRDGHTNSVRKTYEYWNGKDNTISLLVEAIRKYKPTVIMTHGENGEYGHNQHKTTSEAVLLAVAAAANPKQFPESYAEYGAWQVLKTYRHEKGDGHIIMDWNVPMEAHDGRTPQQISEIAYFRHTSQYYGGVKFTLGSYYDYYGYTLVDSAVGPDITGGDFFENIP